MLTALIILVAISAIQSFFVFFHMVETMKLRDDLERIPL